MIKYDKILLCLLLLMARSRLRDEFSIHVSHRLFQYVVVFCDFYDRLLFFYDLFMI